MHPTGTARMEREDRGIVEAGAGMMRAVVQGTYGSASVLGLEGIEIPSVGEGEVRVRVGAAGIDRGTWHLMTGVPYLLRLGYGLRGPKVRVPGLDVAGTVDAVGPGVTRFRAGDRVFGIGRGSLAEYALATEEKLAMMPASLSFEEAAVVPVSGMTAIQAVRDVGAVQAGQRVLVTGASGGVGSFAVQVAKASGAEVTGVCSTAKIDFVRSLGADHVIDRVHDDPGSGGPYDLIVDIGGNPSLSRLRRWLTSRGTAVIVGGETDDRWTGGFGRNLRAPLLSPFVRQRLTTLVSKEHHTDLDRLAALIVSGEVTPRIDQVFPLERAADALRYLASGDVRGKIAISI